MMITISFVKSISSGHYDFHESRFKVNCMKCQHFHKNSEAMVDRSCLGQYAKVTFLVFLHIDL